MKIQPANTTVWRVWSSSGKRRALEAVAASPPCQQLDQATHDSAEVQGALAAPREPLTRQAQEAESGMAPPSSYGLTGGSRTS